MNTVGLAASRDSGTGWIQYDEEYRLRFPLEMTHDEKTG
jgi:hypothetical protein